mmetsp:Transcript_13854/g.11830  ORF Transcript_13854/g.11830 Transcript_13854/m.11830 type:complete len:81 (-) Transcript_13854:284-526(-)
MHCLILPIDSSLRMAETSIGGVNRSIVFIIGSVIVFGASLSICIAWTSDRQGSDRISKPRLRFLICVWVAAVQRRAVRLY